MKEKLKVATVVGTRPEIIRLSRVIPTLEKYFKHTLIHTGQNHDYELNEIFFKDLELNKPNYFLGVAKKNASETIGSIIIEIDKILKKIKPDALLILGDTNSCLSAIPAKRNKIPVFHMEAGNRCFDERVPEEINRRIVDHISDINLPYSSISREYLLREGISPDTVIKTGSPMFEVLSHYKENIDNSDILEKLNIEKGKFFLVSCHREENVDDLDNLKKLAVSLNEIANEYDYPIIFSTHPRTKKQIKKSKIKFSKKILFNKPLGFLDYNHLQQTAKAVLSDSGTITEESSILNFPALNIRESHERPEGFEEASVMMVGLEKNRIMQGLKILEKIKNKKNRVTRLVYDYSIPNVAEKVARIILSYTDFVNKTVWKDFS
tara:strand:- start:6572 stop:7708 length:1137 start_codon:yes stop_codon:yes gene_type:complete